MWANDLLTTYEANVEHSGDNGAIPMIPIGHEVKNVDVTVRIDVEGNFQGCDRHRPAEKTVMPVTIESASRTSGPCAHPLIDQIAYLSGEYASFLRGNKAKADAIKRHNLYLEGLQAWADDGAPAKIQSILKYIKNNTIVSDLIEKEAVPKLEKNMNETDSGHDKWLKENIGGVFVRFEVIGTTSETDGTWDDSEVISSWTSRYEKIRNGRMGMCYLTGKYGLLADMNSFPKQIDKKIEKGGAKLLSCNDSDGFTYRGRFGDDKYNAMKIGAEECEKIHIALKWLSVNQAIHPANKRSFIVWNPNNKQIDTQTLFSNDIYVNSLDSANQKSLWMLLNGIRADFNDSDKVCFLGLDAASKGRMAIIYYENMDIETYISAVQKWSNECKALKNGREWNPSLKTIIAYALGTMRDSAPEVTQKLMDKVYSEMLSCVIHRKPIPLYIVQNIAKRAERLITYPEKSDDNTAYPRKMLLTTACAVIHKYDADMNNDAFLSVGLDDSITDRSYLFGRMLAIFEKIEQYKNKKESKKRESAAIRKLSSFCAMPAKTAAELFENLSSYWGKDSSRRFYIGMMSSLVAKMNIYDFNELNKPLDAHWILGYVNQKNELWTPKDERVPIENCNFADSFEETSDVCCGKLLALYEKIERDTTNDKDRIPTALRTVGMFSNSPQKAIEWIEGVKLKPYYTPKEKRFYGKKLDKIHSKIKQENNPLMWHWFYGYLQMKDSFYRQEDDN